MIKASEIMNPQVFTVKTDNTILEAVKILASNKISGLPVVDKENNVIGIISENDIVEFSSSLHIIPLINSSYWVSPYTEVSEISSSRRGYDIISQAKVERVMKKKVITISEDTSWPELVKLMKNNKINHLPVVDEDKKLVGIITRSDLLNYLADHRVLE